MSIRGVYTPVTELRRKVFTEVARLAYEGGDYTRLDELPYKILPGEVATYRDSIFLERAIIGERLRLSIGLPLRDTTEHAPISRGIIDSAIAEKYYDPPLVNIIKFACNKCPDNVVKVSDACRGCLAHPCTIVCPVDACHIVNGRSLIDQDKCIKCGKCITACPYDAIMRSVRPCANACGVDAISSDELGRADIDQDKCVSCGMCLVNCPFGAISDKGQIFQTIIALKDEKVPVYACVAPSFVGQFGPKVTPNRLKSAMIKLGFEDVIEVAIGADLCTVEEAEDFVKEVPDKLKWMGTSCCPSWSVMAKNLFPDFKDNISMALTPMVLTGRLIKKEHPECKVVFVGPCSAKKLEASRTTVRSDIDFVLTYEELMGLFEARDIDFENLNDDEMVFESTADGRGFANGGGVAAAVANVIKNKYPGIEVKTMSADGLAECRKMLMVAKSGKYDGYLLEGMGCPGGCVAGAGTLQPIIKSTNEVKKYKNDAKLKVADETKYREYLELLE
ncbi:4Fe-4S dicluster domain-containing protein [Mycoplasma sp. P36-A1]|uniref:4Fe-4S dicluster domain-containing protein n=1 Tax=Mycoplasma sp. P36-A1 TaxID=3252900 RepID=UPI003C2FEA6D